MTLSQSQMRLISSIGVGILVGTSLIIIIPEGIETVSSAGGSAGNSHQTSALYVRQSSGVQWAASPEVPRAIVGHVAEVLPRGVTRRQEQAPGQPEEPPTIAPSDDSTEYYEGEGGGGGGGHLPTFEIGLSLILGFVLMFLIDRLPRHATERLSSAPATRHISLDNLGAGSASGEDGGEDEGFLSSLTPNARQSRSLATTTGLVIHAVADGIAMGASATASSPQLGLLVFVAIMIHKAPAAFGLTSVLLRQGLSKRAARGPLIVFSLAAPFGALGTFVLISLLGGGNMEGAAGQRWTGLLLLFSAGTFLYVHPRTRVLVRIVSEELT